MTCGKRFDYSREKPSSDSGSCSCLLHSFLRCLDKGKIILDHQSVNGRNELNFLSYKYSFFSLFFERERTILLSHLVRKLDEKM